MSMTKNITEGNIYKNYLLYALPLILSSILASLYSTVDAVIAGKFISEHALGAISSTASYDILFQSLFTGFSGGFSIYIAQLFGKGESASIKQNTVDMVAFTVMVSLGISALSILFRNPVMNYLNIDPVLRRDAEIYFVIYTASYALAYANMVLMRVLYALGVTSFSIYVSLISALLNIGGNLFTVVVLNMGVAGLAISTVCSIAIVTVIYAALLSRVFKELGGPRVSCRFSLKCVRNSLIYTVPAAIQKLAFHATGIFIAPAINGLGADVTTGYSVMSRMYNICGQSFWNMSSAVDCHTAQSVGAGDYKKARRGLSAGFFMNVAALTPFVLVFVFWAEPIASIFFPSGYTGAAFDYAVRFFKVYAVFLYVNMIGHLMHSYMRSIGRVNTVLWVTLFGSVVKVVSTLMLIPRFHIDGIYMGNVLSWLADGALSVVIYFLFYHSERKIKAVIDGIHRRKAM